MERSIGCPNEELVTCTKIEYTHVFDKWTQFVKSIIVRHLVKETISAFDRWIQILFEISKIM